VSPLAEQPTRLLFDENLAARIAGAIADLYPAPCHVSDAGLLGASDHRIWQHARENGYVIVTKDEDFHRLSILYGPPPKVVWIRLGNCSTEEVIGLLRQRRGDIEAFLEHEEAGFLALA
jgi:predicted nuclease of predicted toxin-antitoxin system